MLATNNTYGGFGSLEGVDINIEKMKAYILEVQDSGDAHVEYAYRVWRCLNLLNATLLGYGNKSNFDEHKKKIILMRDGLSLLHKRKGLAWLLSWDWDVVRKDLREAKLEDLVMIKKNLMSRVATANRKEKANIGGMEFREELSYFLGILDEELLGRS
jgi:hypothetical protein